MIILFVLLFAEALSGQFSDTTSLVLLRFSEPMSLEGLTDLSNYLIKDSVGNEYKIHEVKIVRQVGDGIISDTSAVAIISERLPYKKFMVTVINVKDKAGNTIKDKNKQEFVFIGKKDFEKPQINLRRK